MSTAHNIQTLVDEFGTLNAELKQFDALAKRRDELKKQLAEYCDTVSNDEVKLVGSRYFVTFAKPAISRTVKSLPELFSAIGAAAFFDCVKPSITEVCKHLNKTQQAELLESVPGARRLKLVDEVVVKTQEEAALDNFYATLNASLGAMTPPRH
jgi:hypothetical protein